MFVRDSSWRVASPETTLDNARLLARELGITRVVDITRMDWLGLPVYASIRPRGKVLCVNAGKGLTDIDAHVGAFMEAIEYAIAERPRHGELVDLSAEQLSDMLPSNLQLLDFAPKIGKVVRPSDRITCARCKLLSDMSEYMLPAQLVYLPFPTPSNIFGATSNGLASGNSVTEALLHGLFEVIERDALSFEKIQGTSVLVSTDTLPGPFAAWSREWASKGVELVVRFINNVHGLPCFQSYLLDRSGNTINVTSGSGLHSSSKIALSRAICEAAQSRLSHIHGGRDDIVRFYPSYSGHNPMQQATIQKRIIGKLTESRGQMSFHEIEVTPSTSASVDEELQRVEALLARNGFTEIFFHEFATPSPDLSVVKVIVPKLEHIDAQTTRVGRRAIEAVLNA
jgi:ribosomal protein S12 methylthiotransferase accessory factor